jgi:hypothetical protein
VGDHVSFHVGLGFDGLLHTAAMLTAQPQLPVQVGLYLLALRHPVGVARQLADIARMLPGRLSLGVGVGGEDRHEFLVNGVDPRTRGRRTDESLTVLRELLTGRQVTHCGEFFDSTTRSSGRPRRSRCACWWVADRTPSLRRTARFATAGWRSGSRPGGSPWRSPGSTNPRWPKNGRSGPGATGSRCGAHCRVRTGRAGTGSPRPCRSATRCPSSGFRSGARSGRRTSWPTTSRRMSTRVAPTSRSPCPRPSPLENIEAAAEIRRAVLAKTGRAA